MSHTVYHTGYRMLLNLSEEHLGHPELPGLWEQMFRHYVPGLLVCPASVDHGSPCPGGMYVQDRDGKKTAVHYVKGVRHDFDNESPEHRALKERVARVAEGVGARVIVEDRAKHGKRQTDVLVEHPTGVRIAWEIQRSYASTESVLRRSKIARADGLTPMWTTDSSEAKWVERTPWSQIAPASWHVIQAGTSLLLRGGVRLLRPEKCSRRFLSGGGACPVLGRGYCDGYHAEWDSPAVRDIRLDLDQLVEGVATGQYVPLAVPRKRGGENWFWVTQPDAARYQQLQNPPPTPARREDERPAEPKDLDLNCHYDGTARSEPARSEELPGDPSLPARYWAKLPKGRCVYGCVEPARPYICGWRCDKHSPTAIKGAA